MTELTELKDAIDGYHGTAKETADAVKALEQRLDEAEKRANRPAAPGAKTAQAEADAEYKALSTFVRDGNDAELKAMSAGSDPDGGYVTHPVLSHTMTKKLFDQSPMRQLARVETIDKGDSWEEPVDADDIGAEWVGETESRPDTSTAQLGMLRVPVHEIFARQAVTQRLIDDASIDVASWVEGKVTDRFGRSEGGAFVSGSGSLQPQGFLAPTPSSAGDATRSWGTLQYIPSGASASLLADASHNGSEALKAMTWALRAPYRAEAKWLMNSATASAIDGLKDANLNPIWRPGMTAGAPDELFGYPVAFDEHMPDIAAGTLPVAFGDFKRGYLIVDKKGIRWLRDPFTDKPNVLIYAYRRVGGGIANSEAIKLLKIATS
ncbi:MAG: phage major capsid protein [Caulobacter sp.]|nr:phage major capsid protein [Caulobacter sp.]